MRDATTGPRSRWLGPGVAGIGAASFLADLGHEVPTADRPKVWPTTPGNLPVNDSWDDRCMEA